MSKSGILKKAALITAVILLLSGCQGLRELALAEKYGSGQVKTPPKPLLFLKDGEVRIACGNNVLALKGAQVKDNGNGLYLRGELSEDNSTLYYIKEFNEASNTGTLMAVKTDCLSEPYTIDEGVSAAVISQDGDRALFLKNMSDGRGDLYEYETGKGTRMIIDSAIPEGWGFSPNGRNFYCTLDDWYDIELHKMHTVMVVTEDNYYMFDKSGRYKPDIYKDFYLGDDGRLMYNAGGDIYMHDTADKSTELANEASVYMIHGGVDDFLYYSGDELWYKAPDNKSVMLSEKPTNLMFRYTVQRHNFCPDSLSPSYTDTNMWYAFSNRETEIKGDSFLLAEGFFESSSLFDQQLDGQRTLIAEVDFPTAIIDHSFNHIVFMKGVETYITQREASGWDSPEVIKGLYLNSYVGMAPMFDSIDRYCYYVELHKRNDYSGTLCRIDIRTGEVKRIAEGIRSFNLISDIPYAYTYPDKSLCRVISGKPLTITVEKFRDDFISATTDGVFLETYYNSVYYLPEDSDTPQAICLRTDGMIRADGLDYWGELPEDAVKALKELYEDAVYYVGWMAGNESEGAHRSAKEDAALAQELFKRSDLTSETYQMLIDFSAGYLGLSWRMDENDVEKDEAYYKPVVDYFNSAIGAYEQEYAR